MPRYENTPAFKILLNITLKYHQSYQNKVFIMQNPFQCLLLVLNHLHVKGSLILQLFLI